ncbi:lycopene cyclase domain-containing protein [Mangrovibacterium lignilyticum]|uniref:lycopene cyclase domain-containing protein n=1 Tax=Mangrovibacterium lignilyticum TaxID=2668052 RepID=UPI0013D14122|nr:lycopene cyclase domain-containing protein [Mangrovibacterium lignilyticum]
MQAAQFTYAGLLLATLAIPLALSFDKKVHFYTNWRYVFPSIFITGLIFILWDIRFTKVGIWSFSPDYTLGFSCWGLPIEEWAFFIIIPYSCLFIYEVLKAYIPAFDKGNLFAAVSLGLLVIFAAICYFNRSHAYTFFNFLFLTVYLGYTVFRNRFKQHLTKFYLTFLIGLIPFLIINGVLTALPVVEYHPDHIMNIRFLSIPFEDFGYFFLILLMNCTIYETLKEGRFF